MRMSCSAQCLRGRQSIITVISRDGVSDPEAQWEFGIFEISRATSCRKLLELYIELLDEAKAPGDGDGVGRLNCSMHGFKDASDSCMRDWQSLVQSEGFAASKDNPVLFLINQ